MYSHIERVKFICLDVNNHLFTQILKKKTVQVVVDINKIPVEVIQMENDFIRFRFNGEYIDKKIVSIKIEKKYLIRIGTTIDCSVPMRNVKNK